MLPLPPLLLTTPKRNNNRDAGAPIRCRPGSFRVWGSARAPHYRRRHCGASPGRGGGGDGSGLGLVRRQARRSGGLAVCLQLLRRQRGKQGLTVGRMVSPAPDGACVRPVAPLFMGF